MVDPPKKKRPDAIMAIIDSLNKSPLIDSLGGKKVRPTYPGTGMWGNSSLLGEYSGVPGDRAEINPTGNFGEGDAAVPSRGRDPRTTMIHESGHALYGADQNRFEKWNEVSKGLPSFRTTPDADGAWGKPGDWDGFTQSVSPDGAPGAAHSTEKGRISPGGMTLADLLPFKDRGREMTPYEGKAFGALDKYYTGAQPAPTDGVAKSKPNEQFAQAFTNAFSFLSETAKNPGDYRRRIGDLEAATPGMGQVVLDILKTMPQFANHPLKSVFGVK